MSWGTKLVARAGLGCMQLFNSNIHSCFSDAQGVERPHFVFPMHTFPDVLVVTEAPGSPPPLTYGPLDAGAAKLGPGNTAYDDMLINTRLSSCRILSFKRWY
jgi:hypothetical protein